MASTLSAQAHNACIAGQDLGVISDAWHPQNNPNGFVCLGIAENASMHEELSGFINSLSLIGVNNKALTYGDGAAGSDELLKALSTFLTKHFRPFNRIEPAQIVATNGVTSAVEHCAWALANPGEGILLGRPYYRTFLTDIQLRTGAKVVEVSFGSVDPCGPDCASKYEETLLRSHNDGVKISALLLCQPHNPLGRCYSKETMVALMKLCQKYQIHLISDEIYALSTWKNTVDQLQTDPISFESALSINTEGILDPARLHVVWGISKDLGANGLRLGTIISQANLQFLTAIRVCGLFSCPSSLVENAVTELLSDTAFIEKYIRTSSENLSTMYTFAVKLLKKNDIEHMPGANAAFFLWLNLGKKFIKRHPEAAGDEVTATIYDRLLKERVYIVPGTAAGAEEPGWFRLVFSQPDWLVEECVKRISIALS